MLERLFIKTPWWARAIFPGYTWRLPAKEKVVYLTFDDGPHPEITSWVLNLLDAYNAKATFFCLGCNVSAFPETYQQVQQEGHAIGNHTYHHPNGWNTPASQYLSDVEKAATLIEAPLFRPPYGKITAAQARAITKMRGGMKIIMWDVLSADYDTRYSPAQCITNVLRNVEPGSIVVFHDSEKAFPNLKIALPEVLEKLKKDGYRFEKILMELL